MKLIEKIRYQVTIRSVADALNLKEGVLGFYCPFHKDETGTMQLLESDNRFSCGQCRQAGSSIDLVSAVLGLDTDEAVQWIAVRFDIQEDDEHVNDLLSSWKAERDAAKPTLNAVMGTRIQPGISDTDRAIYREIYAQGRLNETASIFLEHKGFSDDQIKHLGFRFLEKPRITLVELETRFTRDQLDEAGLLDRNREFLFQRHGLLIPFGDAGGEPAFLAGWDMSNREHPIIFPKGKNIPLYLTPADVNDAPLFVVEDIPGALAFHRKNFAALAIPGKAGTAEIISCARNRRLSLCGEKDERGNQFNRTILKIANESNLDCSIRETRPAFEDFLDYIVEKRK